MLFYHLGLGYNSKAALQFDLKRVSAFLKGLREAHNIPQWHYLCAPKKAETQQFLQILADALQVPLILCCEAELREQAVFCLTESYRSLEAYGCGSVAEAASLCGAGARAKLLAPRIKFGALTFAAACGAAEGEA